LPKYVTISGSIKSTITFLTKELAEKSAKPFLYIHLLSCPCREQ